MRRLEESGRADGQGGLSARTVRYVFTILRSRWATRSNRGGCRSVRPTGRHRRASRRLVHRRCRRGPRPSSAGSSAGRRPTTGTSAWVGDCSRLPGCAGAKRWPLRWRDVNLDAGRLAVRRSVGVVKAKGAGERLVEGPTKTGWSRVVDLDAGTVAVLRAYRAARALLALNLMRDSALAL